MYHQYKVKAYYAARSGAEAAQKAVLNRVTYAEDGDQSKYDFIEYEIPEGVPALSNVDININNFDTSNLDVRLYKEFIGTTILDYNGVDVEAKEYNLIIKSVAIVGDVEEEVSIVIPTKITDIDSENLNAILVYLNEASEILKSLQNDEGDYLVVKGDPSQYPLHDKTEGSFEENKAESTLLPNNDILSLDGNYFVEGNLDLTGKTISVDGPTNIYVKGSVRIYGGTGNESASINYSTDTNKEDLKFFIFNESVTYEYPYSLQIGEDSNNDKDIFSRAVFYVKNGGVDIHVHKLDFESDVFTNGDIINVTSHSNSNQHIDLIGRIVAPDATVSIGTSDKNKAAINITGIVVGKDIWYNGNNISKLVLNSSGIEDDLIPGMDVFITNVGKGYYR
jgi:hypothetical protein